MKTPELALRFVWDNPAVSVALSGMSNLEQVEENVASANRMEMLSAAEQAQIRELIEQEPEAGRPVLHRLRLLPALPQRHPDPGELPLHELVPGVGHGRRRQEGLRQTEPGGGLDAVRRVDSRARKPKTACSAANASRNARRTCRSSSSCAKWPASWAATIFNLINRKF